MLTDMKVKNAKTCEKRYRLADQDGLYLDVRPNGTKTWLYRYAADDGKRHWKTIGEYPVYSLAEARAKVLEMKRMSEGLVPSTLKSKKNITFEAAAQEYLEKYIPTISNEKEKQNTRRRLEMHVYPLIGGKKIGDVAVSDVYAVAERLEKLNTPETARKVIQLCSRIFRFAMLKEYCLTAPCYALRGSIGTRSKTKDVHFAAIIEPDQVGELMRKIAAYPQTIVRLAMQFSAYTFCRPGEIRRAEWSEIDLDKKLWTIPAEKMKARRDHVVPLAAQVIAILKEMQPITGHGQYVFPNSRAPKGDRPMSENTILVAIRSMGYSKDEMTAHGFRSMASTLLNENKYNFDWIEMQLAHAPRDQVRGVYNRAKYLKERVGMMAWHADHLDSLRDAGA